MIFKPKTQARFVSELQYILLFIGILITMFLSWNVEERMSVDTYKYVQMAKELPKVSDSIFPLFYPIFLRLVNTFVGDYVLSYKLFSLLTILAIFLFVRVKNFKTKSILSVLAFSSFLIVYPFGWFEVLLIPLLILYVYILYQYFTAEKSAEDAGFVWKLSCLLFLMVFTKYNSIFILIGAWCCIPLVYFFSKGKFSKYAISLAVSCVFIAFYLLINFLNTGFVTGSRKVVVDDDLNLWMSASNILYALNPIHIYELYQKFPFYVILSWIVSISFLCYWMYMIYDFFSKNSYKKHILPIILLIHSLVFLAFSVVAYFFTPIDILNPRLLLGFYFFVYMSLVVISNKKFSNVLLVIAYTNLIMQILYYILL